MKMKSLLIGFLTIVLAGTLTVLFLSEEESAKRYMPQEEKPDAKKGFQDAADWIHARRANQETGRVDIKDIKKAHEQINTLQGKKGLDLQWTDAGPTNIGGRTRAIVIDKDNSDIIYTGGVSGGLWKSTTGGGSWKQIVYEGDESTDGIPNLAIASMCQTANGDIYFGTGEGHYKPFPAGTATRGIRGAGMWKSTDGENFTRLSSTWGSPEAEDTWAYVNKLAADPNDANRLFAATAKGIRLSEDGGQTWENPIKNLAGSPYEFFAGDVKISEDGSYVIGSVKDEAWVSHEGGAMDTWQKVSGYDDGQISLSAARLEFGIAPSDKNYMYCQASKSNGSLLAIYRSTDGGLTWEVIGPGGSDTFNPLGDQGTFDNVIAVFPDNKNEIIVGGQLNVWKWQEDGNWEIKSFHALEKSSPMYVHADQHEIKFHPDNPDIVYIGCDGGIHRSLDRGNNWQMMNKNYNITQFYAIGHGPDGSLIGGTQDNGSLLHDPNQIISGGTEHPFYEVSGGDGGYAAISQMDPNIIFSTVYFGALYRSEEKGIEETMFPFYDSYIENTVYPGDEEEGHNFVTPIALWESFNDVNSKDTIRYPIMNDVAQDSLLQIESETVKEHYIRWVADQNYTEGDTIDIVDPYQAALAVGFNGSVWMTREPLNFSADPAVDKFWYPIADTIGLVEVLEWSADGEHLYFANTNGSLYRISGFENAYADSLMSCVHPACELTTTRIARFPNRYITGIGVDPSNADNVAVTLGQFGNSNHIYYSNEATTATETSDAGTFESKQGDLPAMPLYDAVIVWNDSDKVIVGSEFGLFATANFSSASPSWTDENSGADYVPVYDMRQQIMPNGWNHEIDQPTPVRNHGYIWAGTHGRGIFECSEYQGPVGIEPQEEMTTESQGFDLYPNPARNNATISFNLNSTEDVSIRILDIQGRIVKQESFDNLRKGNHNKQLNIAGLKTGTYIVRMTADGNSKVERLIVK
ncbi:MAG: T9SS type A sorting domain-containing protein [Bacteroidales bacterium]